LSTSLVAAGLLAAGIGAGPGCATPVELLRDDDPGTRLSGVNRVREEPGSPGRDEWLPFVLRYASEESLDGELRWNAREVLLTVQVGDGRSLLAVAVDEPRHCEAVVTALEGWYPEPIIEQLAAAKPTLGERLAKLGCPQVRAWALDVTENLKTIPGAWRGVLVEVLLARPMSGDEVALLLERRASEDILSDDEIATPLRVRFATDLVSCAAEALDEKQVEAHKDMAGRVARRRNVPGEVRSELVPALDDLALRRFLKDSRTATSLRRAALHELAKRGRTEWVARVVLDYGEKEEIRGHAITVLGDHWGEDAEEAFAELCHGEPDSPLCAKAREIWEAKEPDGKAGVDAKLRARVIVAAETLEELERVLRAMPADAREQLPASVNGYVEMVQVLGRLNRAIVSAAGKQPIQEFNLSWKSVMNITRKLVSADQIVQCDVAGSVVLYDCLDVREPSMADWAASQAFQRLGQAKKELRPLEQGIWKRLKKPRRSLQREAVKFAKASKDVPDIWRRDKVLRLFSDTSRLLAGYFVQRLVLCCRARLLGAEEEPSCAVLGNQGWSMKACR